MKECKLFLDFKNSEHFYDKKVPIKLAILLKMLIDLQKGSVWKTTLFYRKGYPKPYIYKLLPSES